MMTLTIVDAAKVAQYLQANENVSEVYLVGSIARNGRGNDIDLVIVPTQSEQVDSYLTNCNGFACIFPGQFEDGYKNLKDHRRTLIFNMLGLHFRDLYQTTNVSIFNLDLHIAYGDWVDSPHYMDAMQLKVNADKL